MKTFIALVAASVIATAASGQSTTVRAHTRSDGTYVPSHQRTNPNSTKLDNWSTRGNVNPYNGRVGTVDPYKTPATTSTYKPYKPRY
jgi:hypothetical protein